MSEDPEVKTLNIDGHEYDIADLSDNAVYAVSQMQYVRGQLDEKKREIDRLQMAHNGFSELLKREMGDLLKPVPEGESDE